MQIADGDRRKPDWDLYWEAREECMKRGAALELVGTADMIDASSEIMEVLLDVSWRYQTHTDLAFGEHPPSPEEIRTAVWVHIGAADREEGRLLDLMRGDLGFAQVRRPTLTPTSPGDRAEPSATTPHKGP